MHALSLGREYSEPFSGLGRNYPTDIANLCAHPTLLCMLCPLAHHNNQHGQITLLIATLSCCTIACT